MALSKTTRDHDEIRRWAEERGAIPAEVTGTERNGEPGILRFEFPKAPNHNDSKLNEISWEDFFDKFDERGLELVYQEVTAEGAESNFNKLVCPENDKASHKGSSGGASHASGHATSSKSGSHSNSSSGSSSHKSSGTHSSSSGSKSDSSHKDQSHSKKNKAA